MKPNASVQATLDELNRSWWAGYNDGYYAPVLTQPEWYKKPYRLFTAYERGYAFGVQLREHESDRIIE